MYNLQVQSQVHMKVWLKGRVNSEFLSDKTLLTPACLQISPAPVHWKTILGVTKYVPLFLRSIIIKALQGIEVTGDMAQKTGDNPHQQ